MMTARCMGPVSAFFLVASIAVTGCTQDSDAYAPPSRGDDDDTGTTLDEPVQVLRVIDGDTLEVDLKGVVEFVRMKGINAPELHPDPPGSPAQAFATEAKDYVFATVGTQVELEWNSDCKSDPLDDCRDPFDRLLAFVRLANGADLGALLLERGLVRVYRTPSGTITAFDRKTEYLALEAAAQSAHLGIWRE